MEARKRKNSGSRLARILRNRAFRKIKSGNSDQDSGNSKVKTPKLIDLKKLAAKLRELQIPPIAKYLGAAALVIAAIIIFAGGEDSVEETAAPERTTGTEKIEPEDPMSVNEIVELPGGDEIEPTGGSDGEEESATTDPGPPKDHVIVIASYKNDPGQLKPVAEYFAGKGIETEVESAGGGWYRLVTKERFVKPGDHLSKIADQKKLIAVIGKGYKPPDGFLPFRFDSVYSVKVND